MIDTDKYGMTNEELLDTYSSLSVDDYKDLLAEVKRLREVAYITTLWKRDKEIGRLREGIKELAKIYKDSTNNPYLNDALKELIE
jgi:hypothetical protein